MPDIVDELLTDDSRLLCVRYKAAEEIMRLRARESELIKSNNAYRDRALAAEEDARRLRRRQDDLLLVLSNKVVISFKEAQGGTK